ncbi:hypothetical protein FHS38_004251 [Streptomyces netropsis]|uniref:Uncharacterized protein n=1 Tax=Streptomyces netropsis TaxID=55404 RepID=A0A7W7PGF8_STRNE|nr:hypothetical protein [Streptomyces netropsis]GGR31437.1 hypothetical protein GCM10010219_40170 [Streptomyces netropsis]
MYTGFTWPLVGGMAATRVGGGGAPGRGALLAAIGAAALPLGFVLGREIQRRITGSVWMAEPAPEKGNDLSVVPAPPYSAPAVPVGPPSWRRQKWEARR